MKALVLAVSTALLLFGGGYAAGAENDSLLSEDEVTLDRLEHVLPPPDRGGGAAGRTQRPLPKVGILLTFAPNSTALSEKGMKVLGVLHEAMEDMWAQYDFVIEGHADRIGNARANETLSLRRAEKVRDTLLKLGVSPERLVAMGKGSQEPVNLSNPSDPRNRRVVFQPKYPAQ